MNQTSQPLFEKYFTPNLAYKGKLIDKEFDFLFQHTWVVDIPFAGSLYMQSEKFDLPQFTVDKFALSIGCSLSEAYRPLTRTGLLVGSVCLCINDKPLKRYEKIGSVRVDSGRLQVATGDLTARIEAIMKEANIEDGGDFFEELKDGELKKKCPNIQFKEIFEDDLTYVAELDGITYVDIKAGYGDGEYPIYVAYDEDDQARAIYVDFLLFERADMMEWLVQNQ
jgi:hypothetical protein